MKVINEQAPNRPSIFKTAPKIVGVNGAPAQPTAVQPAPNFPPVAPVGFNPEVPKGWTSPGVPREASVPASPTGKYPAPPISNPPPNPTLAAANLAIKIKSGKAS
jgi:hypothetical protein